MTKQFIKLASLDIVKRKRGKSNKETYAIWVGDRSGSMFNLVDSHLSGYNNFVEEQKKQSGKMYLTTIRFDDEIEVIGKNVKIEEVTKADYRTFESRGCTALYDSIGEAIEIMKENYEKNNNDNKNYNYIIMVMTDGMENSSRKYNRSSIKKLIEKCKTEYKWDIKFMATNQNAEHSGSKLGLIKEDCLTFTSTPLGMTNLMRAVSNTVSRYRSTGNSQFTPELKKQLFK